MSMGRRSFLGKKFKIIALGVTAVLCVTMVVIYFSRPVAEIKEINNLNDPICIEQMKNKNLFDIQYDGDYQKNNELWKYYDVVNKKPGQKNVKFSSCMYTPKELIENNILEDPRSQGFYEDPQHNNEYNYWSLILEDASDITKSWGIPHSFKVKESLTEEQKNILNKYKDILYIEMYIDKYLFYLKIGPEKQYEIITKEELVKNVHYTEKRSLVYNIKKEDNPKVRIKYIN